MMTRDQGSGVRGQARTPLTATQRRARIAGLRRMARNAWALFYANGGYRAYRRGCGVTLSLYDGARRLDRRIQHEYGANPILNEDVYGLPLFRTLNPNPQLLTPVSGAS